MVLQVQLFLPARYGVAPRRSPASLLDVDLVLAVAVVARLMVVVAAALQCPMWRNQPFEMLKHRNRRHWKYKHCLLQMNRARTRRVQHRNLHL